MPAWCLGFGSFSYFSEISVDEEEDIDGQRWIRQLSLTRNTDKTDYWLRTKEPAFYVWLRYSSDRFTNFQNTIRFKWPGSYEKQWHANKQKMWVWDFELTWLGLAQKLGLTTANQVGGWERGRLCVSDLSSLFLVESMVAARLSWQLGQLELTGTETGVDYSRWRERGAGKAGCQWCEVNSATQLTQVPALAPC